MNEGWHKARTLAAKRLADFIRSRPEGVTIHDLKANGLTTWGLDRLLKLGHVRAEQVREPERGPRAYHWVWTADTGCAGNCAACDMARKMIDECSSACSGYTCTYCELLSGKTCPARVYLAEHHYPDAWEVKP